LLSENVIGKVRDINARVTLTRQIKIAALKLGEDTEPRLKKLIKVGSDLSLIASVTLVRSHIRQPRSNWLIDVEHVRVLMPTVGISLHLNSARRVVQYKRSILKEEPYTDGLYNNNIIIVVIIDITKVTIQTFCRMSE
jgi:hypothetical protein